MAQLDNGLESLNATDKTRNYLIGGEVSAGTVASLLTAIVCTIAASTIVLSPKAADMDEVADFAVGEVAAETNQNFSLVAYHSSLTNTVVYAAVAGAAVIPAEVAAYPTLEELEAALPNALPGKILRICGLKVSETGGVLAVLRDGAHRGLGLDELEKDTSGSFAPDITTP